MWIKLNKIKITSKEKSQILAQLPQNEETIINQMKYFNFRW